MNKQIVVTKEAADRFASTRSPTQRSLLYKTCQSICRLACTLLFDTKVYGLHNIPKQGGVLLASTHASYLDPILLGVRLTRPVSYMAKSELFTNPLFGWLIFNLHAFPIRQGKGDRGAILQTIERLKQGHMLTIFPEGTRSPDGTIQTVQSGVALVLRKADVPVVPVVIHGAYDVWPMHKKLFRTGKTSVMFGPPLYMSHLPGAEITATLQKTFAAMMEELKQKA